MNKNIPMSTFSILFDCGVNVECLFIQKKRYLLTREFIS